MPLSHHDTEKNYSKFIVSGCGKCERWLPGGHLLEKWIESKTLTPEEADAVRADAKRKFEKMFEDDDAEFKGVLQ